MFSQLFVFFLNKQWYKKIWKFSNDFNRLDWPEKLESPNCLQILCPSIWSAALKAFVKTKLHIFDSSFYHSLISSFHDWYKSDLSLLASQCWRARQFAAKHNWWFYATKKAPTIKHRPASQQDTHDARSLPVEPHLDHLPLCMLRAPPGKKKNTDNDNYVISFIVHWTSQPRSQRNRVQQCI